LGHGTGFIVPDPPPPIVIGAFGPKMAALAGEVGDGINTHASGRAAETVIDIARRAHAAAGRDPAGFLVTLSAVLGPRSFDADRLAAYGALGVHRVVHLVHAPFDVEAIRAMRLPPRES
jgi:alkanesulfonate monooxygenase SsuD/methylene tetrahydromethanopterin reductase-like flavin-dependent oxidoreductase (luciferase family)